MKPAVRRQLGGDVPALGRLGAVARGLRDPLHGVVVQSRQCPAHRTLLQQLPQRVDLHEVLGVKLGDEIAAPRPVYDLTFLLERAQRFPHRCHADAEVLGDLLLQDSLSRAEFPLHDGPAQRVEGVLGRRSGAALARRRHHRDSNGGRGYRKASMPVSALPMTRACTSAVPS